MKKIGHNHFICHYYCHFSALVAVFLILSIISTAFAAVCIPKKIHRIFVFLFHAFILEIK